MNNVTIHVGSNLDVLPTLAENSIDAIVTDPPYELGFMGKAWDASGIAYNVELWRQCLRVLKPGGHLLAFSGSRTYHRMTCAIEDAGFEVRDQIMWVYGSGFPKSLNVGKALDKMDAAEAQMKRRFAFTEWVRSQGVTSKQINEATGTMMGSHYTTELSQPAVMTVEHLEACRHLFKEVPAWVEDEARKRSVESENFKKREVLSKMMAIDTTHSRPACSISSQGLEKTKRREINITAPYIDAAKQWDGWGTALKPAHEPICVARKPLDGTVADNVMKWGTGAINVDGCRVGTDGGTAWESTGDKNDEGQFGGGIKDGKVKQLNVGRWPANLIHDGSDEVLELFPESNGGAAPKKANDITTLYEGGWKGINREERIEFGKGSAARFFYCPKASKKDRDDGCENMEARRESDREKDSGVGGDNTRNRTNEARRNFHPTVKPTELMRYLCRLVTPPGGTVLDPFMGSGSTGRGAVLDGFAFTGIELSDEYAVIARARIDAALKSRQTPT